jgi:hypothetical protein
MLIYKFYVEVSWGSRDDQAVVFGLYHTCNQLQKTEFYEHPLCKLSANSECIKGSGSSGRC